jgi:3'-phosphoadenosine 5'-phosphosulfate sulfotransferase (PAPS reductase)/FAD synthetase
MSNKHDFKIRPVFTRELWDSFTHKVVMGGMGDDTAMMIAELFYRGFEPNEIVFCETGSEFPHTYEFIKHLQKWCKDNNWSKVVVLNKLDKFNDPLSVISMVTDQNTLPAAAFGSKSCSLRFKVETADKYFNNSVECWNAWGVSKKGAPAKLHTGKILRLVGLNFDEPNRVQGWRNEPKWTQAFPLFDWEIGEAESEAVEKVGLYYPGKSSCTICPNMTHGEIAMLRDDYPVIYKQALGIEENYRKTSLINSDQDDLFGDDSYDNTVMGLGGRNGKTWPQMLKEYDTNPQNYKQSTNKKPCECGH